MITAAAKPVIGPVARGIFTPELLDRCISCGFCLPACPTYALTGVETSSPRGRINLMRALETDVLPDDDPTVLEESSFCLGCRACESVCPAGVQYGELVEEWRDHLWTDAGVPRSSAAAVGGKFAAARAHDGARAAARRPSRRCARPRDLMLGGLERGLYPRVNRDASSLPRTRGAGCPGVLWRTACSQRRAQARQGAGHRAGRRTSRDDRARRQVGAPHI